MTSSQRVLESGQSHTSQERPRFHAGRLLAGLALALAAQLASGCGVEADEPGSEGDVSPNAAALSIAGTANLGAAIKTPVIFVQLVADLKPDGTMRFYDAGSGKISVQINVTNVGNAPAWGPAGTVQINGSQVDGVLYQYFGGTATMANTVNPGQRGYILVKLPTGALSPCMKVGVNIDVGHNMQTGLPDPFANDLATVATQCLTWDTTISSNNFPIGGPPLEGNSIFRIVSSFTVGRADGFKCSQCHFQGSGRAYSPPVAAGGSAVITAGQVIGGLTWTQSGGWAERFIHQPTDTSLGSKPFSLKLLFQTWLDHGRKPGNVLRQQLIGNVPDVVFTLAN